MEVFFEPFIKHIAFRRMTAPMLAFLVLKQIHCAKCAIVLFTFYFQCYI